MCAPTTLLQERTAEPHNMPIDRATAYVLEISIVRLYIMMHFVVHECPISFDENISSYFMSLGR